MLPITIDARRRELQERSDCSFVGRGEFLRMLMSTDRLIRADERLGRLRGLLDLKSNCRFLIEEEELFREPSVPRFEHG